jgi:zinc transport system ATP-binding protein
MHTVDHTQNIIEVKNISFAYNEQLVLKDVTFNIHKGDYLGLIGPNGGGKTTLLKLMLGLLVPKSGSISIFGQDNRNFKGWSKIGYVAQHAVQFDVNFPATVEEVVAMGLYGKKGFFHNLDKNDKAKIAEVLTNVEMLEFKNRLIGDLSGGQQQRVFIARALVSNPEVLFLDEPTAGVDVKTQENFYKFLHNLNERYDLTLVLISHDIEVMANEATEFASINQSLVYHGSPEGFMKGNYSQDAYGKYLHFIGDHKN